MSLLNRPAYEVEKDNLVYDAKHPVDVKVVQVKVTADEAGVIKRGQVIDSEAGEYSIHAASGEPCMIAEEDTSYAADDTEVAVLVYISGTFRASEVIANPELTDADIETLRIKNIILK